MGGGIWGGLGVIMKMWGSGLSKNKKVRGPFRI